MADNRRSGQLAVILHADVAGSTALVREDEQLAHERIQDTFHRFGNTITKYHGHVRELRGDALLAEFERASDAVTAALAFQTDQIDFNARLGDGIQPTVRVGIAMGEVIIADDTITGEGVVLAQRLEQLSEPGSVAIQGAAYETIPGRFPFDYENLGEHEVKGFDEPVRVYAASLKRDTDIPQPSPLAHQTRKTVIAFASVAVVVSGIALMWFTPWRTGEEPAPRESATVPVSDRPSIAVLPFDNFSGDETFDYMSDGISENIITALAQSPWLLVMSRTSSFVYKDRAVTAQQVGNELGVQYVLEGSVQKGGDTVRITAQLIDAATGNHLWTEKFDQVSADPLAIQDAVAGKINQTLSSSTGVALQAARRRAWVKDPVDLEEYDIMLRGHDYFLRWTQDETAKAREIFEQGLERFPDSALLKTKVAWALFSQVLQGWSPNPNDDAQAAIALAEQAVADTRASLLTEFLARWALASLYASVDTSRALAEMETAVALVPGDGMARADLAGFQFFTGDVAEGWKNLALAERVDPNYPWILYFKAFGFRAERNCRAGIDAIRTFFEAPLKYLFIAACHAALNEPGPADTALAKAKELWPDVTVSLHRDSLWFTDQIVIQEYLDDLRRAGLPER